MSENLDRIVKHTEEKLGPSGQLGSLVRKSRSLPEPIRKIILDRLDANDDYDNAEMHFPFEKGLFLVKTSRKFELFDHKCHLTVIRYDWNPTEL